LTRVYTGLDGLLGRMAHLMAGSAKSRLMYELIIECRRFGEKNKDGSCLININETDVASRAGLSRETVSREIQKLRKDNLLRPAQKGILINDLDQFEKKLGEAL